MKFNWTINVSLILPWRGEVSDIAKRIKEDRQEIIDQIHAYPTLDGASGIIHAVFAGGSEPEHWIGGERNYWHQRMAVMVDDRDDVAILE
jgi:hypothetical protein